MQSWQTTYLGLKGFPRELSAFELQTFLTFSRAEREVIDARYGAPHKLGLVLHMGFLRLNGRSLSAIRVVLVPLWINLAKSSAFPCRNWPHSKLCMPKAELFLTIANWPKKHWGFAC